MSSQQCSRKSGQAVVLVTCVLVPMLMMLGLVADLGYMHYVRQGSERLPIPRH